MRRWMWLALIAPALLHAAPDVESQAVDRAHVALAEGHPRQAAAGLAAALGKVADADAQARIRCLLGAAHLDAGAPARAEPVLAAVPDDAPCGPRAAFLRADALLALGQAEAAAEIYDRVGGPRLGEDRDAAGAQAIARIARRLLDDPDRGRPQGLRILSSTLGLRLAPDVRRDLARELADRLVDEPQAHHQAPVCEALLDALRDRDDVDDRLRASTVCGAAQAWPLLAPLDDTAAVLAARARHVDADGADVLRSRALEIEAGGDDASKLRTVLAEARANRGRLDALPLLEASSDADALRLRADLLARAGRLEASVALLDQHRADFPANPHRNEVHAARGARVLALARRAHQDGRFDDALSFYDDVLQNHGDDASLPAWEAGVAARGSGDAEEATRRWEEVVARWPHSAGSVRAVGGLARQLAIDEDNPDAAFALLRRLGNQDSAAADVADALRTTDVWIDGGDRVARDPVVRVGTRNLEQVELKLHRIDAEAFVRSGGSVGGLRDLDVAVVAPDRTWTVDVPDPRPHVDVAFDVPVAVPGPGLYAVTVASGREEAKALISVGDLILVSRAVGPDLAVATFVEGGRPAPGTRVVAVAGDTIVEGRTDASGLWTTPIPDQGALVVLALRDGAPAMLEVPRQPPAIRVGPEVRTEVERPIVLPGDTVGVRSVIRREGTPISGTWTVWLESSGRAMSSFEATSDRHGRMVMEIEIPPVEGSRTWEIRAVPPGEAVPLHLGQVRSLSAAPSPRSLTVAMDGDDAVVRVREMDGTPAVGVPVVWGDDGVGTTDASGQVRVSGPAAGVPWHLMARIPGDGSWASAAREARERPALAWRVDQDRLRPSEAARVHLVGDGPARVEVMRLVEAPAAADPIQDPWMPTLRSGPIGSVTWAGSGPGLPSVVEDTRRVLEVVATQAGAEVDVGVLEPGRWRIRAADRSGWATSAWADLTVDGASTRVVGARDVSLGERLELGAEGGPALVTVESDRLLWAFVGRDGRRAAVDVRPHWGSTAVVAATSPEGDVHARSVAVDPALQVALEATPRSDGKVDVRAQVTNGAGDPVQAQVSLAGWDRRLEAAVGRAASLGSGPFVVHVPQVPPAGGVARAWRDADAGQPISGALRAEARRLEEREQARAAATGMLSDNNLARAMLGEVPVPARDGFGGLGSRGTGSGAGGYGSAGGQLGGRGQGTVAGAPPPGARERVLWAVREADADGVVTAVLDGPPAQWRIRASAVLGAAVGLEEVQVRSDERLWLAVHAPEPGLPGDRAAPRVTVVNGTDRELDGEVRATDATHPVALGPGEAQTVTLSDPQAAGPDPVLVSATAGGLAAEAVWPFGLAAGVPEAEGPIATVTVGPEGAVPSALLAMADDDPVRRGRSALAALPRRGDPILERAVRDARDALRFRNGGDVRSRAASVLFLAELDDHGLLPVSPAELREVADGLPAPTSPAVGVWVALAQARAGLPVDADLVEVLRAAPLTDEERPVLARVLALLGLPGAAELAVGTSVHAQAARAQLGLQVDVDALLAAGPPDVEAVGRADWIRLVSGRREKRRGQATVRVGGTAVATLDLSTGGRVRVLADGPVTVDAPAVVERSGPPPTGDVPVVGVRLPRSSTGRPMQVPLGRDPEPEAGCAPCRLQVGESLFLPVVGTMFEPRAPGHYVLRPGPIGRKTAAAVAVDVVEGPVDTPLHPAVAVARSEERLAAGLDPEVVALTEPPDLARRTAWIAFQHALKGSDEAEVATRFRTLAIVWRDASVDLADVARSARALAATGDPVGATRVWRAGLDAAFRSEAAALRRVEHDLGVLATVKLVRDAALRYPDGASVGEALYLLPAQLRGMADGGLPDEVSAAGISAMDLRLQAAAWDREFLALNRDHDRAPAAGLRLARSLVSLGVPDRAAAWSSAVGRAHPDDPLLDALTYLEALARTEAGLGGGRVLLERLVDEPFPDPHGVPGPSVHRSEAQLVLGRFHEARGDVERALAVYDAVADSIPEASRSQMALREVRLEVPPTVRVPAGSSATGIDAVVQGVDSVRVRAYAVDLRTLFLRDGGLQGVRDVSVAGVSPAWSGERQVKAGPFPEERFLDLPLSGAGAWLVQVDGGGPRSSTLVVRSALQLATTDVGGVRRVTVRRQGVPVAGAEVRALHGPGTAVAAVTDVRGVAEVPSGAAVLVWKGQDLAFTDPHTPPTPGGAPPRTGLDALFQGLDARLGTQQQADDSAYRKRFDAAAPAAMSLEAL